MHCTICGTINPALARFCMGCGNSLVSGIVCSNCQTLLPPQARYCYYCGAFQAQPQSGGAQASASPAPIQRRIGPVGAKMDTLVTKPT